jgi:hypothetical protein
MKLPIMVFILFLIPALLWNHEIFLLINGFHSNLADQVIGVLTGFGDGLVVTLFIFMLMLFKLRLGLAALLAFLLSGTITQIIKRSLDLPQVLGEIVLRVKTLATRGYTKRPRGALLQLVIDLRSRMRRIGGSL